MLLARHTAFSLQRDVSRTLGVDPEPFENIPARLGEKQERCDIENGGYTEHECAKARHGQPQRLS